MSDEDTIQLQKDLINGKIAQARLAAIDECIAVFESWAHGETHYRVLRRTLEALKGDPQ